MPTYDYKCNACDHTFELFQQMIDSVKKKCPECGELKLKRLIGAGSGVMFKGSGFYETDYRSSSYTKGEKDAKDANSSKSKGEEKSDSKKDSKKESKSKPSSSTEKD